MSDFANLLTVLIEIMMFRVGLKFSRRLSDFGFLECF